ncbi:MAG: hypothetical protein V2A79_02190 [Planctomycetota bacterium]
MKNCSRFVWAVGLLLLPAAAHGAVFDSDGDGDVDLIDLQGFVTCLAGPDVVVPPECAVFDEDSDSHVDLFDFAGFQLAFTGSTPGVITRTELAGNSLSQYPFFEYVKAFNRNASVKVAIDPTRYADIVGRTCDVYVVDHKSSGGWSVDPSLVDVTAGGLLTATFAGATIQGNTFTVTGANELDADAGTGLGVGYDMVLDCNQDAELNGGDYIDGLGAEAGLYAVHNVTLPGPLAVTEVNPFDVGTVYGIPSGYTLEDVYYPTNIASMGQLPLIVVSHGNGHQYYWYDHIGYHMASYGYIVMSHQNNTVPGIETCSLTTLGHTDAFIDKHDLVSGGVLAGHLDSHHIIWIGHSRGAEGVARAYDRITDTPPSYTPVNFTADDIVLISSMAPTDFLGTSSSNPHEKNYHLWTAAADDDVSGDPSNDIAQTLHLHDRATGYRQSTILHGVGHGDLHDGGGSSVAFGPCLIGRDRTHLIQKGYFLPLIKYYVEANVPALDFLTRQWEDFKPIGAPTLACAVTGGDAVVVDNTYRNAASSGNFMIDDFQTQTSTGTSSSGGTVTFTVENLVENRLDDGDTAFTWTTSDPMNGMTYGRSSDTTRGVVFDWNAANRFIEWEIIPSERDFSDNLYLSFRACQGTRHPYTISVIQDLTFTVTLRDGLGTTSSINIGAYGGGLEDPYQRAGAGTGTGWGNDFEQIRPRLTDFLNNGSGLDLANIVAVRFNVGPSWGASQGRIGVDELMVTNDYPAAFIPLTMSLAAPTPEFVPPGVPTTIDVEIDEGSDTLVPGSALLYYRYGGGAYLTSPLVLISGNLYRGTLPAPDCTDTPEYYFGAEGIVTGPVYLPSAAPASTYTSTVGTVTVVLDDNFETDQGWSVENIALTDGAWERGIPAGDGTRGDPTTDYDGSGQCYLTANRAGNSDVDGGPTRLISPTLDLSATVDPVLRYARWWANDDQDSDPFDVEVSNDNGGSWIMIERAVNIPQGWVLRDVNIADYITLTSQMKIRFSAMDNPNNSIDEGGVDAVKIFDVECP